MIGSYCGVYVCVPPQGRDVLTRLTLAILDYAVNDPVQYAKRTKQMEIYLDENGEFATQDTAARKITATIPIDEPSVELKALDKANVWIEFQKQGLKKQDADNLIKESLKLDAEDAKSKNKPFDELQARTLYQDPIHWPTRYRDAYRGKFPRSLEVFDFFAKNGPFYAITPYDAPSDELLTGPATFEHKGSASTGLQMI